MNQSDYYFDFLRGVHDLAVLNARHVTADLLQILIKIRAGTQPVMKRSLAL